MLFPTTKSVLKNHKISIKKYSFHWQDKYKKLVMRWDNAPHHPGLDNFPHHLHLEGETKPSTEPYFINILQKIEDEVEMD